MKKVSRLFKRGNNNKKAKSAQEYNAFDTNLPSATKSGLAVVHKPQQKTTKTTKPTSTSSSSNKGTNVLTNSKSHKLQLQSKHQLPSDVNINYASLNRRARNKHQRKRWRYYYLCRFCCCGRNSKHKGYWQPTKASTSNCSNSNRKIKTKNRFTRWVCRYVCCCFKSNKNYQYDTDDDDDIDGKFAAYICEMKERETSAIRKLEIDVVESTPYVLNLDDGSSSVEKLIIPTHENDKNITSHINNNKSNNNKEKELVVLSKVRVWTWDDSLRSNSDRFLETLEEDNAMNHVSFSKSFLRRPTLLSVAIKPTSNGEEAKAAAEELNQSPTGQRKTDPTSSPLQSRASSDAWPAQSDEDIDRLVAMHQNRNSLSSLGLRSDSMASVYSGAGEGRYGTVVVKGQVEFGMQYNYKLGALEIHVVRCKDLAAVDSKRNRSDPYVKVYLLPDKSKAGKRKTKVKKHTLNPIFDEILRFHMPIASLETRNLWLTVWHSDMFGRNDFLGEVSVNLQGKVFDNPQSQWYLLQERSEPFDEVASYRGDIVVGLKFIPPENQKSGFFRSSITGGNLRKFGSIKSVTSKSDRTAKGGQLHVLVKEAKHLSPVKANGCCDAFCKSYLLPDRSRSSKQKTPVVKRTLHPSWNYTFVYEDVSLEDLSERALELTVWDHDRLASNEFIGGVRFSLGTGTNYGRQVEWMDATGKELSLWQNMLDRPNFWVEGSLVLRSTLDGVRPLQ